MDKLKVMTVVGTRPEIIRLAPTIKKLDLSPAIDHILVHTGQNFDRELNDIFFEDLNLRKPDINLGAAGKTAMQTVGNILSKIDEVLENEKPDAFLVLGDTNSCLSVIAAKRHHIPIFHLEAGNRCFDQRVPEETNRKIVDNVSDINLTYSDIARQHLLAEGFHPDRVIKVGSPMKEALNEILPKAKSSDVLKRLGVEKGKFFVVSAHRDENISSDSGFKNICGILRSLAEIYKIPVIVTTHPRTRKRIEAEGVKFSPLVHLEKPFSMSDYLCLQLNARATISDSGTISEESSLLGFPALNLREAHERPEAMEEASVIMTGVNEKRVLQGIAQLEAEKKAGAKFFAARDYEAENVSDKIVRIIISYTDYVKRVVWGEK